MKGFVTALIFFLSASAVLAQATQPAAQVQSGVPAAITQTGEYAKQIYEAAQAGRWKPAFNKLSPLTQSSRQIPPNLTVAGNRALQDQIRSAVNQLATTVSVQDQVRTMSQASIIIRDAAELESRFHPPVPVQVNDMDFYGRQLQVGAITGDTPFLQQTARQMAQTWQQLRPVVVQHGGMAPASHLDDVIQKIQSANRSAEYDKLAQNELDQVKQLKALFGEQTAASK